ncbi:MAG: ferrochelatase [Ferrovum sp.]|nr:ferrochelatase [Ferrovum sp.]NDU87103.1 ferrochelatase [Ferrovum sp.]
MPHYLPEPPYTHGQLTQRIGLILVNLGTPDAPDAPALKRYLAQFLGDPRVVEIPRPVWWLLLHGIILNTRPRQSAKKYATIWMPEGSPLRIYTERQARGLEARLADHYPDNPPVVRVAMRYGQPSISQAVSELKQAGCDRLLLLPLYPQYAASTTGSSQAALFDALNLWRTAPGVRTVRHYHDDPGYIAALKERIEAFWAEHGRPQVLVMSFHGVPKYTLDKGDPYHCECLKTGRLLAEALNLQGSDYRISFQSLFGRTEWVKPYTAPLVEQLAREGVRHVQVVCPGFPADCLETLEEIGMEVKATFLTHGGETYHYIPALNDDPAWLDALSAIARNNLGGWLPQMPPSAQEQESTQRRAAERGATN